MHIIQRHIQIRIIHITQIIIVSKTMNNIFNGLDSKLEYEYLEEQYSIAVKVFIFIRYF